MHDNREIVAQDKAGRACAGPNVRGVESKKLEDGQENPALQKQHRFVGHSYGATTLPLQP